MNICGCGCGRAANGRFLPGHRITSRRTIDGRGAVLVYQPTHPLATTKGYVMEHRLVVESAIGHMLPLKHPIHHVDENPANNAKTNLVACENQGYHMLLHQRARAFRACGHADWLSCVLCGQYDAPSNLYIIRRGAGRIGRHRACHAKRAREAQLKEQVA